MLVNLISNIYNNLTQMELRRKDRKPSLKSNSVQEEIHDNKHIKFSEQVIVESHKEAIHFDQSNHKFKEAQTHYQDIV